MKNKPEAKFESINKEEAAVFAKEVFKKHAELINLINQAPLHLACSLQIKREFGTVTETSVVSINYPLVGSSEIFTHMREEQEEIV